MAASISKTLARLKIYRGTTQPSFSSTPAISTLPETQSTASSQSQGQDRRPKWSRFLLFVPGAITFGLGTWQIFRRQEKIKTLEYRHQRLEMEPVRLNTVSLSSKDLDSLEFRRVICKGVFEEGKSIYIGPRSRAISGVTENGYYVITPLMPVPSNPDSVQSPILVNRGWVPRSWREKALKDSEDVKQPSNSDPPKTEQISSWKFWAKKPKVTEDLVPDVTSTEVVGVIRGSENPSIFVPANDPSSCQWFYVDIPAVARTCGLPPNTIYIEEHNENVNPSDPYPLPKDVNSLIRSSVMPQDHLNYMLTWYSLSAAVTFMAFKRIMPERRRRL